MMHNVLLHRPKKKAKTKTRITHRTPLDESPLLSHEGRSSYRMYLAGILIISILFAAFWSYLPSHVKETTTLPKTAEKRPTETYEVIGRVPVVEWSKDKSVIQYVTKQHNPIVLRNTFVKDWEALSTWNPEYLSSFLGKLRDVYIHSKRLFGPYYDPTRPMTELPTIKRDSNAYKLTNMTASEFWRKTLSFKQNKQQKGTDQHNDEFVYYASNVEALPSLLPDIDPIEPLMFNTADQQNVNIWFGGNQVATHTHYDSYHNLYVQIYGTKRWILFPPSEAAKLYLFPFLHPSHAQLQVDVHNLSHASRFPSIRDAKALEVTIRPGEMLYLPPMWFHYVEAGDVSISVNSWSYSEQSDIMEQVYELDLPFDEPEFADGMLRSGAVAVFLRMLVRKTHQNDNFLKTLYITRYETLVEGGILPSVHPHCTKKGYDDTPELSRRIMNKFVDAVHAAAFLVNKLPIETREIWLMNYVEYIISVTNGVEHVGSYLKTCIPSPNK